MSKTSEQYVEKWLALNKEGHFAEARDFYFDSLFASVIEDFKERTEGRFKKRGVLFSVLGYTPEPIILTQRALEPKKHIIFYTKNGEQFDNEIAPYLEKYLTSNFELVEFENTSFDTIYKVMKEQMALNCSQEYYIDITGGKKSMVASAAIFARDHNCNLLYVDYDEYIEELRRPRPGTEDLLLVYSPYENLPDVKNMLLENNL